MRRVQLLLSVLVLGFILVACAPQAAPAPAPQAPAAAPRPAAPAPAVVPAAPAKPAWQVEWERVLAEARKEGVVAVSLDGGAQTRSTLKKIAGLQGLDTELTVIRTAEFFPRILAERRAGLYLTDVRFAGYTTMLTEGKPAGILEPMDSALILPDLTNPELISKVWYQGRFPWIDKDRTVCIPSLQSGTSIIINTNLVKPDDIKSYRDLLAAKWKEKLIVNDPTVSGAGQMGIQALLGLMGEDFIRELAAAGPIVMRDQRQMLDWLAHGKVAIVVAPQPDAWVEFVQIGAPIKSVIPKEGTWLSSGAGGLASLNNKPHPNAAKIFLNLFLSKEGQEIYTTTVLHNSLRLDVPTAHLPPERIRDERVKYIDTYSEEAILVGRPVAAKLAAQLFGKK